MSTYSSLRCGHGHGRRRCVRILWSGAAAWPLIVVELCFFIAPSSPQRRAGITLSVSSVALPRRLFIDQSGEACAFHAMVPSGTPASGSGVLAARENLMSRARRLSPEREFVVAAIILAAAAGATIFWLVHRPVAALHPPVAESVAAPTLAAPEVSRPMTADTPVAAQQPKQPQEVKSRAEAPHIPRWGVWLAADVSEDMAWTLYRKTARQFASLIGDREPIVLFRQLPGMGNAKRYVIAIVDDDRAPLDKFCKKLTAAGSTCNVMRNEVGPD